MRAAKPADVTDLYGKKKGHHHHHKEDPSVVAERARAKMRAKNEADEHDDDDDEDIDHIPSMNPIPRKVMTITNVVYLLFV